MSEIQNFWIYLNHIEDEKERFKEIKVLMREINWRLKPETAKEFDKQERISETDSDLSDKQIQVLDKFFEEK